MKIRKDLGSDAVRDLVERASARVQEQPERSVRDPWPSSSRVISESVETPITDLTTYRASRTVAAVSTSPEDRVSFTVIDGAIHYNHPHLDSVLVFTPSAAEDTANVLLDLVRAMRMEGA